MYMSVVSGPASTFALTVRQMPDPSVDSANCFPVVTPSTGMLSRDKVTILITYNCNSIGRSRIYLGVTLNGTCLSNAVW